MKDKSLNKWRVYHIVPLNSFAHYHFYNRKIKALNSSGLNAKTLNFVTEKIYKDNSKKYENAKRDQSNKIFHVKNRSSISINILLFTLKELFIGRKLVFHVLRVDDSIILLFLKKIPVIKNRLIIVQEFEGDRYEEYKYLENYVNSKNSREIASNLKSKLTLSFYSIFERLQLYNSDALILMSKEHEELLKDRYKLKHKVLTLPTLPEEERIYYSDLEREHIRNSLCINEKIVLIYTGNIFSPWQRFEEMCIFVKNINLKIHNLAFLLIVREVDLKDAAIKIKEFGLEDITILDNVSSNEVYKYISAADLALFVRHNHKMNRIVTSGKLGEYIATGLPVITTASNASVLNEYMDLNYLSVDINEELVITDKVLSRIKLQELNEANRVDLQNLFYKRFNMNYLLNHEYPNFIKNLISDKKK